MVDEESKISDQFQQLSILSIRFTFFLSFSNGNCILLFKEIRILHPFKSSRILIISFERHQTID